MHIRHGIVRLPMGDTVGPGQLFELVYRQALFIHRPLYAFAAQRAGCAHQIDQIPA